MFRRWLIVLVFLTSAAYGGWEDQYKGDPTFLEMPPTLQQEGEKAAQDYQRFLQQQELIRQQRETELREQLERLKSAYEYQNLCKRMNREVCEDLSFEGVFNQTTTKWFKNTFSAYSNAVFLAMGSPLKTFDPASSDTEKLIQILKHLAKAGIFVVYDADSMARSFVEQAISPDLRLGISGNRQIRSDSVLTITNSYLRMEAILSINRIIFSPDSILGAGLFLKGYSNHHFFILTETMIKNGLSDWSEEIREKERSYSLRTRRMGNFDTSSVRLPSLFQRWNIFPTTIYPETQQNLQGESHPHQHIAEIPPQEPPPTPMENLGIDFRAQPRIQENRSPKKLVLSLVSSIQTAGYHGDSSPPKFDFDTVIDRLKSEEILRIVLSSNEYFEKLSRLEMNACTGLSGCGATVFGSSRGSSCFETLVAKSVKKFADAGLSISTGGAGGYMELANRVAFSAGVRSIGIPITHSAGLRIESRISTDYHTITLPTEDYAQRIPLLLYKKSHLIFAPGGEGTIQELATALVQASSLRGSPSKFFFISSDYYQGLVKWFSNLSLPPDFTNQIRLIHDQTPEVQSWTPVITPVQKSKFSHLGSIL